MIRTHFEAIKHRKDGSFAVASSTLTGQIWDGNLWVFKSTQDFQQCPNLYLTNTRTQAGISDFLWISNEQALLVASDSGELEVWSCNSLGGTLEHRGSLRAHDDMVLCICRLGEDMVWGRDKVVSGGADGRVIVWDVASSKQLNNYKGHRQMVHSVASKSADTFVSTSQDGSIRLWDLRLPKPASDIAAVAGCDEDVYTSLAFGKECLAIGSERGVVRILDLREDQYFLYARSDLHTRSIHRLAFAPWDCDLLASVSDDNRVLVRSIRNSKTLYCSEEHLDFVRGVSWDPDSSGRGLVTCGWGGQVLQHSIPDIEEDTSPEATAPPTNQPLVVGTTAIDAKIASHPLTKLGTENVKVSRPVQSCMEP